MASPSFPFLAAAAGRDCERTQEGRGADLVLPQCVALSLAYRDSYGSVRSSPYKATDLRFVFSQQGGQDLLPSLCAPALGLGPTFGLPGSGWVWASLLLVW